MNNLCEICEEKRLEIYCKDCPRIRLYCEECFIITHKAESKKLHTYDKHITTSQIQNTSPLFVFCSKHQKEEKKYCCMKCNESVCGECSLIGDHKGHEISTFKAGFEKESKEFNASLEDYQKVFKFGSKVSDFLSNDIAMLKKLREETEKNFEILEEALKKKKLKVLKNIDSAIEGRTKDKDFADDIDSKAKILIEDCKSTIASIKAFACSSYDYLRNKSCKLKNLALDAEKLLPLKDAKVLPYTLLKYEDKLKAIQNINLTKEELSYEYCYGLGNLLESKIVTNSENIRLLTNWLPKAEKGAYTLKLIYRGSVDGYSASAFHSKCNNKGPTLIVILPNNDKVFGGYTSLDWQSSGPWKYDAKAFIYSLDKKVKCDVQNDTRRSIYDGQSYGPIFGNGHDFCIYDNCNTSNSNYSYGNATYKLPPGSDRETFFAGKYCFTVKEIEVYSVTKI